MPPLSAGIMKVNLAVAHAIIRIIDKEPHILLGKRKDNNLLAMPGGKPERDDEFLSQATKRETFEETGLKITNLIPINNWYQYEWFMVYDFRDSELWLTTFFVSLFPEDQVIVNKEEDKHEYWNWYSIRQFLSQCKDPYTPKKLFDALLYKFSNYQEKNGERPLSQD